MGDVLDLAGERCLMLDPDGAPIADASGVRDLIEDAMNERASVIAVPAERLDPPFFQLRSGLMGELVQKAANYGRKLAVVGDVSQHVAASEAFRDFVVETERGTSVMFVPDVAALERRLREARTH